MSYQPNQITREEQDFYISYNGSRIGILTYGEDTTALVTDGHYYILLGNHVKAYADCKGLNECMDYFIQHIDQIAPLSETPKDKDTGDRC